MDHDSPHLDDDAWLEMLQQHLEEAQERGETLDLAPFLAQRPRLRERALLQRQLLRGLRQEDTAEPSAAKPSAAMDWPQIAGFEILGELGTGGMGTVYLAEQRDAIRRRVALKVIKLGMDTKAVLARFEAERQALALMDHPSIAKVFEAGATPEGRPYFAMEYVRGVSITRYCDDNRLSIEERLHLFRQVCSGVQHAHQKGVIHRDLTPNNVLVTLHDGKPMAKIIDFGLARATDHRLTEKTLFTEQGVILGTPEYMSPEQAGLNSLDIDMRSDVYTLGVLLYELLTGALPFSREQLRQAGYDKMCAIIRTQEPERPSTRITKQAKGTETAAKLRRTNADKLLRRLRGDLDWVVLKCLEKDRTRRYETVSQLAEDVQRHLDHQPVLARAPSVGYRLAKLGRRYRGQLVAAGVVLGALVAGLVGMWVFWQEAEAQAVEAKRQEGIAQTNAHEAETARAGEAAKAKEASANAALAQRNAEDAQRSAKDAQRSAKDAQRSAKDALDRKGEFDQLAGVVYLERALAAEKTLYPPWPKKIARLGDGRGAVAPPWPSPTDRGAVGVRMPSRDDHALVDGRGSFHSRWRRKPAGSARHRAVSAVGKSSGRLQRRLVLPRACGQLPAQRVWLERHARQRMGVVRRLVRQLRVTDSPWRWAASGRTILLGPREPRRQLRPRRDRRAICGSQAHPPDGP